MSQQSIISCRNLSKSIAEACQSDYDTLFILVDNQTRSHCLPLLQDSELVAKAHLIEIASTDTNKSIQAVMHVWQELSSHGASRHSLLINLGGGMVTDLGGFAAATFKRGIDYINIPTTLLSMVDAAVGGKTGFNFNGLKNEIGAFSPAKSVLLYAPFLRTIDQENLLSGYAEMLKHGLISTQNHLDQLLAFNLDTIDYEALQTLIHLSVATKQDIVAKDPHEHGIRKALNLGHTFGHAFESLSIAENRPVLHGYAVAWGLVCELYLSVIKSRFNKEQLKQITTFIEKHYGSFPFDRTQYACLYTYMQHDKKNKGGVINFTLLQSVGAVCIDQQASKEEIFEAFDFFRKMLQE